MTSGGSRTLKLSILGDVDQLKKSLNDGANEVEGFGSKLGNFSKVAGAAFAAAGIAAAAYAGKLLVDGVKSAIEDEAAQKRLATTLENVTGATAAQVKGVEDQIFKTEMLTGLTEDQLRPSLDRLVRATGDVTEAQKLQALAIDISAGSGKSLEAISNALGKAAEGNTTALGKLGVGLTKAELKSMSMEQITAKLGATFKDQASKHAETFQGKMERLSTAFSEAKETVGTYVLDAMTPLVSGIVDNVIPAISGFAQNLGEKLGPAFGNIVKVVKEDLLPILTKWWGFLIDDVIPAIIKFVTPIISGIAGAFDTVKKALEDNSEALQPFFNLLAKLWNFAKDHLIPLLGGAFKLALQAIGDIVATLVKAFAGLLKMITAVVNAVKSVGKVASGIGGFIGGIFGGGKANGGPVSGGTTYLVGERGPELFTPSSSGAIIPNGGGGGTTINITVNGAIDSEGTARQIIDLLNRSNARGTLGANRLVFN